MVNIRYVIILFCLTISCSTKSKLGNVKPEISDGEAVAFPLDTAEEITNISNRQFPDGSKETLIQDSIDFFNKHIEPISPSDLKILSKNEDYKFPDLLNNRNFTFEDGDISYSFSSSLDSKIGYSTSESLSTGKYNISIYDSNNDIVGHTTVEALGSEEAFDRFIPYENGKGFIQIAKRLDLSASLKVYSKIGKSNHYVEKFSFTSDAEIVVPISMSKNSKYFTFIKRDQNNINTLLKYDINGKLHLEKEFLNVRILPPSLNISPDGEFISFSLFELNNGKYENNKYYVINGKGNIIIDKNVITAGNYNSEFIELNDQKYLIAQGLYVYIFNLVTNKLIKEIMTPIDDPNMIAYRMYIINDELYILFISYNSIDGKSIQNVKILQKYDIANGRLLSSLKIPLTFQISLFYEQEQFYLQNYNNNKIIYKLKL